MMIHKKLCVAGIHIFMICNHILEIVTKCLCIKFLTLMEVKSVCKVDIYNNIIFIKIILNSLI